jgi:hypothetical protein
VSVEEAPAGVAGPGGRGGGAATAAEFAAATGTQEVPVDVAGFAAALADGIEAALPGWVGRAVAETMTAWTGSVPPEVAALAAAAADRAAAEVGPRVRALLESDIDQQRTTPLAILRVAAVRYPTEVLVAAGVPPVVRDQAAEELFPDDRYDLVPAAFSDLDPGLADVGLRWGAAKAFEHKRRHGGSR